MSIEISHKKILALIFFVSNNAEVTVVTSCDDLTDFSVTKMMKLVTLFCLVNVLVIDRVTTTFEQLLLSVKFRMNWQVLTISGKVIVSIQC